MGNKILLLGADGMAGHMVRTYLEEQGYEIATTTRDRSEGKNHHFDVIENYQTLDSIVAEEKPKFVINCIGVLNQFAEDHKSEAVLINSFLPHYIDSLGAKTGAKLIHISTDCVFDGAKGQYAETDLPDAQTFYGRTKSLGEVKNDRSLTFRTSIVGPDINKSGIGLFQWFMKQTGEIKGFTRVIWTGVTTLQLAKAIEQSFSMEVAGLYHLVNNDTINKYELLQLFKKYMVKDIVIKEDDSYVSDKSLANNRTDFNFQIPSYEQMVQEMAEWTKQHRDLYKHMFVSN